MFRLLLDEGFPSPAFDPTQLDPQLDVQALRDFDPSLLSGRTPDWYLYLRAHEAGFHAFVTGDLSQSGQAAEMWTLARTPLSVITWRAPEEDPVVRWAQLLAYLPEIRRMISQHGNSIVCLPRARLTRNQLGRASGALGKIAADEGRAQADVHRDAEHSVREALRDRGELERLDPARARPGQNPSV